MKNTILALIIFVSLAMASCASSKKNACPAYSTTSIEKQHLLASK